MNLKKKISLIISLLFTIIFAIASVVIYVLYSDFRKDEFEKRLNEKAISTIKLLVEVKQVDKQLLKIIDQNSIHKLYNEKTLIFDANYQLIYSSLDDTKVQWSIEDLVYLKNHKTFFKKDKDQEIHGFFYDTKDNDYFALVSASDSYGKRKLEYLFYVLLLTYLIFTTIAWFITYKAIQKLLLPLDDFHNKIKGINEQNLDTRIASKAKKDEIDLLAQEFNLMLERIDLFYSKQQEFTSNASHEFRTPLGRLVAKLENKLADDSVTENSRRFLLSILNDVNQLIELTNSLLVLSKLDKDNMSQEICRIDEIVFESIEHIKKFYPDLKIELNFEEINSFEIPGNKSLLLIAFNNLFKNAYLYSSSKIVKVSIYSDLNLLKICISNDGYIIAEEDRNRLFEPFMRGKNSIEQSGLGLGLRIVHRILSVHKAKIQYQVSEKKLNTFELVFNI